MHCHRGETDELVESMQEFWSVESLGVSSTATSLRSKEDQRAEEVLNMTARRCGKPGFSGERIMKSYHPVTTSRKSVSDNRKRK